MHVLAGIDLNLVVALHALLEEESVTAAARRAGVSQPAMSHALSRLRTHFDDPLLIRSGRAMVPTPTAHRLLEHVRGAVTHLETLMVPDAFDPSTLEASVRLVTDDYIGTVHLPEILRVLGALAPGMAFDVLQRGPPGRKALLRQGKAELAIGHFSGAGMDLHRLDLYEEGWVCVVRTGHPMLQEPFTPEVWASMTHVIVSPTGGRRGRVDARLQERGLERRVTLAVPHFTTALAVVAGTDHVCTTAASLVRGRSDLAVVDPPIPMAPFPVSLLWHERTEHDRVQRWLREQVVEVLQ